MEKIECDYCGAVLEGEEAEDPRMVDNLPVCDDCYKEHFQFFCPMCQEHQDIEGDQNHMFIPEEMAEEQGMEAGIYRIKECPWFISDMFSMTVIKENVERIADLRDDLLECGQGDYICNNCIERKGGG